MEDIVLVQSLVAMDGSTTRYCLGSVFGSHGWEYN
jgi:hypothetical protein